MILYSCMDFRTIRMVVQIEKIFKDKFLQNPYCMVPYSPYKFCIAIRTIVQ